MSNPVILETPPHALPTTTGEWAKLDDGRAVLGWLEVVHQRNLKTFRSYQAEARRFRLYLETIHAHDPNRSGAHLMRDASEKEIGDYEGVLRGRLRNGKKSPVIVVPREILERSGYHRQPFVTEEICQGLVHPKPIALKESSVNQALTILHALYQYWLQPDPLTKTAYVGANPVRRVKSASNRMQRQTSRNFPMEAVTAMMEAMDLEFAQIDPDSPKGEIKQSQLARRRWIVALFFGLWGRRSEIANLLMKDFVHNGSRWHVHVVRKGGKHQNLPVAPWVIQELARYRQSLGMTPLPSPDDSEPALVRIRKLSEKQATILRKNQALRQPGDEADVIITMNGDMLYREVKAAALGAAAAIRGGQVLVDLPTVESELVAKRLDEVTPHWFRHSGASMAINTGAMSLENASKMLGHSSTTITSEMYHHPDEAQIEEGMQNLGAKAFS